MSEKPSGSRADVIVLGAGLAGLAVTYFRLGKIEQSKECFLKAKNLGYVNQGLKEAFEALGAPLS